MPVKGMEEQSKEQIEQVSEELFERLTLVVDKGQEPLRIDKFLLSRVVNTSRNKIQQSIDNELCW
jgi:23S rRNA pseudouridine1911/1915/1917 synthase